MRWMILVLVFWPGLLAAQCVQPGNARAMTQAIYQGVNAQRTAQGLPGLAPEARLATAAQGHACDLARSGAVSHRGSDGSDVQDRVTRAGVRSCLSAENLAWGFADPARVMTGWMASPGHRANILHRRVTAMGVSVVQGAEGPLWVLVLARPC